MVAGTVVTATATKRPALLALILLGACRGRAPAEESAAQSPAHVRCAAVASAAIGGELMVRGTIAPPPLAQAVVAATVPGRIAKLYVQEGDVVAARDLIAEIEDPALGAATSATGAEVEAARVEL